MSSFLLYYYYFIFSNFFRVTDELKLVHQQLRETRLKNEQMQVTKDNFIKKLEEQLCEKQREISKLSEEVCYQLCVALLKNGLKYHFILNYCLLKKCNQ